MTANFFQSLERFGVAYLLISGQATVLYGAATFSEDIDLWVAPDASNIRAFLNALRACDAAFYKLTPPPTEENFRARHGFHFTISDGKSDVFLDVMGVPPRVGPFAEAEREFFDTQWGRIPVIGIRELVEIKKTQRLEDYAIISRLALRASELPGFTNDDQDFDWVRQNIFTLEHLETWFRTRPEASAQINDSIQREFGKHIVRDSEPPPLLERQVRTSLQTRMEALQHADRQYWKPIVAELRQFRARKELMPEGVLVSTFR